MATKWVRLGLASVLGSAIWLALCYLDGGKGRLFVDRHLWAIIFAPLLAAFFILFAWNFYKQYRD